MVFEHQVEHVDDDMILIQANIDDMNPEFCSYVSDKLFEQGANDVYWIPIIMKKGRPGVMLNVLVAAERLGAMEAVIFRETTSIGLRYVRAACHRLGREQVDIPTRWGKISAKVGYYNGKMVQFSPEFSECERVAKQHSVPLKQVYDEVRRYFVAGGLG